MDDTKPACIALVATSSWTVLFDQGAQQLVLGWKGCAPPGHGSGWILHVLPKYERLAVRAPTLRARRVITDYIPP